jgi:HEPN domain-containing protein
MESLSQFLRETVKQMDEDLIKETPPEEQAEVAEWVAQKMTSYLLKSIESFSDKTASGIEAAFGLGIKELKGFFQDRFDEYYTRSLLEKIPSMIARTMRLSRLVPRKLPSPAVELYLRESTRSYIFGFWQASIALSRAAVEHGLRESVRDVLGRSSMKFSDLVRAGRRLSPPLIDEVHEKLASQVELRGNRVLHGEPAIERDAWETLRAARAVLNHLFGLRRKG